MPITDLSTVAWRKMCRDAGQRCHYCGKVSKLLHKEHNIRLARGGSNSASNIVPACPACNLGKATMTGEEWLNKLAEVKRRKQIRLL